MGRDECQEGQRLDLRDPQGNVEGQLEAPALDQHCDFPYLIEDTKTDAAVSLDY